MKLLSSDRLGRTLVLFLIGLGAPLLSCSNYTSFRDAQVAEAAEDWDRAVLDYLDLVHRDPTDLRYRAALLRAKMQASHSHFERAKKYREAGLLRQAMVELQKSVQLDPTNQYARSQLDKVREEIRAAEAGLDHRPTLAEMKKESAGARPQPPVLNPRSPEPIDLDFSEPASIKKIYQALGKAFGINVMFDPNLRDQEMSIQLQQVTAQTALETVMRTAQHFYKVLDEHTIIVVADTPQNRRIYEDLIIQTFFLSNSDVKEVMTMLRSLVDSRKIAANEQLNAIILRDTVDKVKVAERIIRANDKAKAEVIIDVELLQLNTSKLQDLGLTLGSYQVGVSLDTGGGIGADTSVPLRFNDLEFINSSNWLLTIPNFLFDFVKNSTEAQTLAKPQLRISEGETARLTIGDRVPVPVTTFNTSNTVGSNIIPLTSFQYQDVGIRIEIEPRVHHNDEISLKVMIEVSNIAGNIGNQPIIGTRMIETTIRLRDGETNFLAGLIRTDETNSEDGIPGLSDIPLLGRLFSKKRSQNQRTDIVLTLTPHIIRRANITEQDLMPIWVGTEQNVTFRGGSPRIESGNQGPFDREQESSTDAADAVRRRLQRLPRGLRPQRQEGEQTKEQPPSGVDLVQPGTTRNPLDRRPPRRPPPDLSQHLLQRDGESGAATDRWGTPSGLLVTASVLPWSFVSSAWQRRPRLARGTPLGGAEGRRPGVQGAGALASKSLDSNGPLDFEALGPGGEDGPARPEPPEHPLEDPPASGAVQVSLFADRQQVAEGEIVEITIVGASDEPVSHLPMRMTYDASRLEWQGAEEGGWLVDGGGQSQLLVEEQNPGVLVVGASRLGSVGGVTGSGSVVRLRFLAKDPGPATVSFGQVDALSRDLSLRPVDIEQGIIGVLVTSVHIPRDTPAPRPAVRDGVSP